MLGLGGAGGLTGAYVRVAQQAFAPDGLPTWLPRLVVLVLGARGAVRGLERGADGGPPPAARAVLVARRAARRSRRAEAVAHCWRAMWDLLRGAAAAAAARTGRARRGATSSCSPTTWASRAFASCSSPSHDLDAHRDLVFALVAESRRRGIIRRPSTEAADARRAEVLDLAGVARDAPGRRGGGVADGADRDRSACDDLRARRLLARRNASAVRSARQPDADCSTSWSRSGRRTGRDRVGGAGTRPVRTRWPPGASTAKAGWASICSRLKPRPSATRRGSAWPARPRWLRSRFARRTIRSARSISAAGTTIAPTGASRSPS